MKNLCLCLLLLFNVVYVSAQDKGVRALIEEGVELHDNGDYKAAIKKYEEALKIDNDNTYAISEASMTYLTLKEYEKSIQYCDRLIALNGENVIHAYMNKGTALDLMGKYDESVTVYKEGIKKFPEEFLLHFNLGITYLKGSELTKAENEMYKALEFNPEHSSSNLMLAYTMYYKQSKVRAMLAFYYFLMLEPRGERAKNAFKMLNEVMGAGVEKESRNKINITMAADRDTTDPFYTADFYFTLKAATLFAGEDAKKSEFEKFHSYTEDVVKFLGEKVDKDNTGNFFINLYVRFLRDLEKEGHLKTYCYHISQSSISESAKWVSNNGAEMDKFIDWFEQYTSNNKLRNAKPIKIDPNEKKKRR